jgi:Fe-S-cluster-containing hydrogenase component 2
MLNYESTGILSVKDLDIPSKKQLEKGVAVIECIQKIPCNPCVDSCKFGAIHMKDINAPPIVDYDKCTACTQCVGICPGLAIFVIKIINDKALITLPYEFYPIPEINSTVKALDREGKIRSDAIVKKVRKKEKTSVITIEVKKTLAMEIRNIKV